MSQPRMIIFYPNGTAAVTDQDGAQMSQYQDGWHGTTIEALKRDGIDYRNIRTRLGEPLDSPPTWFQIAQIDNPLEQFVAQRLDQGRTAYTPAEVETLVRTAWRLGRHSGIVNPGPSIEELLADDDAE